MAHSIGKTIAELRKAKGWTQIELAEKLQVSDKTISKWEKDGRAPSIEFFPILAKIFNVSIDYLMVGNSNEVIEKSDNSLEDVVDHNETLEEFIHSDIISINELLTTNNYKLIKKGLSEHYIHIVEKLNCLYQDNEYRTLFEFAIDNNDDSLANAIANKNVQAIEKNILSYLSDSKLANLNINKNHLFIMVNNKKLEILPSTIGMRGINRPSTLNEAIWFFNDCRNRILDELSLKLDKEKTVGDLTKEYFEEELLKGNTDIVVVKLCVRLEAILKCDYHYEGTLEDMLKSYCTNKLTWEEDDGWGYMNWRKDEKTINLLHSLRMKRNSIVHAEKTNVQLSIEDIKYCIDYICKLG